MTSHTSTDALVAFGSNLGDSREFLSRVIDQLDRHPSIQLRSVADPVETQAVLGQSPPTPDAHPSGNDSARVDELNSTPLNSVYLNSVFRLSTTFDHQQLLQHLLLIESELGRVRQQRWDARTVDLDLLLFGNLVIDSPTLTLPHPRMSYRRFVLEPAMSIAGDMFHPVTNCTLNQLLECLNRRGRFWILLIDPDAPTYPKLDQLVAEIKKNAAHWHLKKLFFDEKKLIDDCRSIADLPPITDLRPVELRAPQLETDGLLSTLAPRLDLGITDHWSPSSLLVVVSKLAATQWIQISNRFQGPTLLLDPDSTRLRQEITAALEAMES